MGHICTNDLLDLFYYASSTKSILVCDDRWINSYNNLNECSIYSTTDIVELLHEQKIISDEKYINIITQMFNEGYAYIVPPLEYSQDYGVAAMALGKGAFAIHQSGKWYTNDNIDQMLMERHLNKKARRSSHKNHIKGPKKRTEEDDERFTQSFEKMIKMAQESEM